MRFLFLLLLMFFDSKFAFSQSNKNYLINSGFDLWQLGTTNAKLSSPFDTKGYLADRWFVTTTTNVTYDQNSSNLPTGHKYGAQIALSAASAWLCQRIESQNTLGLSGKKMTISGWERSSSGTDSFKLKIDRPNTVDDYSGVGKDGTTLTNELAATTLLTSTSTTLTQWRYTFTVSANMASYGFQVCLGTNSSVSTTYQISAVMLNEGSKKEKFERTGKTISDEISLAQRYVEKSYNINVDPGTSTGDGEIYWIAATDSSANAGGKIFYKNFKRVAASSIYFFRSNGTINQWDCSQSAGGTTPTMGSQYSGQSGITVYGQCSTNWAAAFIGGHFVAISEL